MARDFIDIAIDEGAEDANGDWWDSPFGWSEWLAAANSRGPGDTVHLGCDAQFLVDRFTFSKEFEISATGDETGYFALKGGNIGSRIDTTLSEESWWAVGDRPEYFRRTGYKGVKYLTFTGDKYIVEGLRARNYETALTFTQNQTSPKLYNMQFRSCRFGIDFKGSVDDGEFTGLAGKNITSTLLAFRGAVTNTRISDISSLNNNCEDGESIGMRFWSQNNHNVTISDVNIGGQRDHYVGLIPKNPFHDGSEYAPYTQGEALAIEGGTDFVIERFCVWDTTDRLIDCKASAIIRHSGGYFSKRGITVWGDNSRLEYCFVGGAQQTGNTSGTAYLLLGANCVMHYCTARFDLRATSACIQVSRGSIHKIEGGEYLLPETKPFLIAASVGNGAATVELVDVVINGQVYNETVTLASSGDTWTA
ncbi:MAG: hypothetical protein MI796_05430 [Enterobacterales bacterium]|nr:hypothetical protein [Enterobacterales bacterium]